MWLHYHPDAVIFFRDANDAIVAQWTFDEFKDDYGQPFPPLPNGAAQLELYEGRVYIYDAKHNERDAFMVNAAPYKAVLEALPRLLEAKKERLAALDRARMPKRIGADRP